MPSHWFWLTTVFFWLAVLSFMTYVQFNALAGTDNALSWGQVWLKLSPWFLNWIWVSAGIFMVTEAYDSPYVTRRHRVIAHLIAAVVLLFSYASLSTLMRVLIDNNFTVQDFFPRLITVFSGSIHLDILIYIGVLFLAGGTRFYHAAMKTKIEVKQLQTALVEEQLKTLRTQLNPHFLFNALNTVASLVRLQREDDAIKSLASLSNMLRTILDNKSNKEVKIRDEVEFIKSYLDIQKMRFAEKLDPHIHVDNDCYNVYIPNMLLHPLVENAVAHGSQSESKHNPLHINININRQDDMLNITMLNAISKNDDHNGYGIGLSNTKERLSRLFDKFQLNLNLRDDGMFETQLIIPLNDFRA